MADTLPSNVGGAAVMDGFTNLSIIRQVGLMIGLAASVAIGFGVVLWSQEPDYRPLYADMSNLDAVSVSSMLAQQNIRYKMDMEKGVLMVESGKVHDARLALASAGLPSGSGIGYELLDKDTKLGTSQFMEQARYHRSIEGELAKTISNIDSVRTARVHLAIPRRTVFVGDNREPSASVFVDLYPGRSLEKHQIASVVHLVASSIPQLNSKKVTVIDQKGRLLSDSGGDSDIAVAAKNLEYHRALEDKYRDRVINILTPILGVDRFNVQVSAEVDFTQMEQTAESYNPDLPALRSEQVLKEEQAAGAGAMGVPGALSNQPPVDGAAPEVAAGETAEATGDSASNSRSQATRNYELDRTISYTKHQVGGVQKLSVAVVVDDKVEKGSSGGEVNRTPLTADEIERLTILVKDAIGFNATRGDSVTVLNQPFVFEEETFEVVEKAFYENDWFWDVTKTGLGWFLLLILILGVLRPILKGLAASAGDVTMPDEVDEIEIAPELDMDEMVTISGGPESLLPGPEEGYEEQLSAVKGMVAEDPRRVAQVIKTWIGNEQ